MTLRERFPRFLAVNVMALALGVMFAVLYLPDIEKGLPLIPTGSYFTDLFAAKNLPFGAADLLNAAAGNPSDLGSSPFRFAACGLYTLLAAACVELCKHIVELPGFRPTLARLTPPESMFLVIGSLLMTGCFFSGQSIGYRGIFLLLILPGLLALSRNAGDRNMRLLGSGTSALLVFLMWGEFLRTHLLAALTWLDAGARLTHLAWFGFWLVRELVWWWLMSVLGAIIFHILSRSGSGLSLLMLFQRRRGRNQPLPMSR
jgi:hypothetical protein